jgi:hypothetical protein
MVPDPAPLFRGTDPNPDQYQNATDTPMFVNVFVYAIEFFV